MARFLPTRSAAAAPGQQQAGEDAVHTTQQRVRRAAPSLARVGVERMEATLPFFAEIAPDQRATIGLVLQAGLTAFSGWLANPGDGNAVTDDVFAVAPRDLARSISLQQTVAMVRIIVDTVESRVEELAEPDAVHWLREAVLRYSREIAFAAAQVYAAAAENRGAWDARLEASVVDALLRGEADGGAEAAALLSRAAALGWRAGDSVAVLVGRQPEKTLDVVLDGLHHAARGAGHDLLAAVAGLRVCAAWPGAPRPVSSAALLPERALGGDAEGRRSLVEQVYDPLVELDLLSTVAAYLEDAGTVDGAARLLFVHPNTVRYRLRRALDVTGQNALDPRGALVLRLALAFGRLDGPDRTLD